jgi:hypothetical protein
LSRCVRSTSLGRGYAQEAVAAMADHGFQCLGFGTIRADIERAKYGGHVSSPDACSVARAHSRESASKTRCWRNDFTKLRKIRRYIAHLPIAAYHSEGILLQ